MLGFIIKMVVAGAGMQAGIKLGDFLIQRAKEKFPPGSRHCPHCNTGTLLPFEEKSKKGVVTRFGFKCANCLTEFEGKVPTPAPEAAPKAKGN